MKTRLLGATGLHVSEIGFGCGTGARLMIDGAPDAQVGAVRSALDAGITYFDTAPIYGAGRSETSLGRALRVLGANVTVATKVALELGDLDDIAGATVASIEASLRRLGREHVNVVHLHNRVARQRSAKSDLGVGAMLTIDDILGPNGVVPGFRIAKQRGWADWFGCCSYGGETAGLEVLIDSGMFDTMLVHYSMLNQTAFIRGGESGERDYGGVAARAAARGMGISNLRVLEAGLLADNSRERAKPEYAREAERARSLDPLRENGSLTETAIRFALSNPAVSTVLIGVSEVAHVEAAVAAEACGPLPASTLAEIERRRAAGFPSSPSRGALC